MLEIFVNMTILELSYVNIYVCVSLCRRFMMVLRLLNESFQDKEKEEEEQCLDHCCSLTFNMFTGVLDHFSPWCEIPHGCHGATRFEVLFREHRGSEAPRLPLVSQNELWKLTVKGRK